MHEELKESSRNVLYFDSHLTCCHRGSVRIRWILLVLILFLPSKGSLLPAQNKEFAFSSPVIQKVELLNGLNLLTAEVPGSNRVVVNFLIKSGYGMDPDKKQGVAFLTAYGILEANKKVTQQRWKDELDFLEAIFSIHVEADSTLFHAELPAKNLEPFLNTISNLLVRPIFQKEGLDRMKEQVSEYVSASPAEFLSSLLDPGLFGRGYCSHRLIGDPDALKEIGLPDVEAFHNTYFLPNNAAIAVVGPLGMSSLATLIREKFGGWTKGFQPHLPDPPISTLVDTEIRIFEKKGTSDVTLLFGNPGPSRQTPDYYSLVMLAKLLGGNSQHSRLRQELDHGGIQFQSIRCELQLGLTCGKFKIQAQAPPSSIKPILEAIQRVIDELKANKASDEALARVRLEIIDSFQKSVTSPQGFAQAMAEIELQGLPRDFLLTFPRSLEVISADRLQEAAKNYLTPRGAVVILGDREKIEEVLR
jgi:zinc protease